MVQPSILPTDFPLPTLEFTPDSALGRDAAILFLHGIGERGSDLSRVTRFGLPAALDSGRARANCAVLCPQLPDGLEWTPGLVYPLLQRVRERFHRTAIIGFSLGGLGVLELAAQHGAVSDVFISIAGRARLQPTADQAGVVLLSLQGELDVQPAVTAFVHKVRQLGGNAEDVVLPKQNHFISELALWHSALQAALGTLEIELSRVPAA